jgi:hypothetical protein
MKNSLEKLFTIKGVVWPQFLPVLAVLFGILGDKEIFFISAVISIIFYSCFAFEIHNIPPAKNNLNDKKETWPTLGHNKWFVYNQYWLNGLGSFVGWLALYLLLFYVIKIDNYPLWLAMKFWTEHFGIRDLILIVVSFLGLTGYIPHYALIGKGSNQI